MTSEPRIDHPIGLLFQVVGTEVNGTNSTPGLRKVPGLETKPGAGLAGQGKARPARAVSARGRESFSWRGQWEAADFFLAGERGLMNVSSASEW